MESVAVAVAVVVDPGKAALSRFQMPLDQRSVARGAPGRMQRDEIQRGGIRSAVVGRVRDQFEMSELPVAHFVQDLAGFGIAEIVSLLGHARTKYFERTL